MAIDYTHSLIVFAIRGTNTSSTRSLGSDLLSLLPVPLPQLCTGCSGSAPWLAGWTDVKAAVTQAIQDALKKNPTFKVLITGHSLGGAVASLAAFDLRKAGSSLSLVSGHEFLHSVPSHVDYGSNQSDCHIGNIRSTKIWQFRPRKTGQRTRWCE